MEDLWHELEKAVEEVEDFFKDVSDTVEFFTEELGKTVEHFAQEVEETIVIEIERCVEDLIDIIYDSDFQENNIFAEDLSNFVESEFMAVSTYKPSAENHPACIGCSHYHGKAYNGNLLVCAMHPYGSQDNSCIDWEN